MIQNPLGIDAFKRPHLLYEAKRIMSTRYTHLLCKDPNFTAKESSVNVMTSKKSHVPDDLLSHVFSSVLGESILNTQISKTSNDQCEGIMSEN